MASLCSVQVGAKQKTVKEYHGYLLILKADFFDARSGIFLASGSCMIVKKLHTYISLKGRLFSTNNTPCYNLQFFPFFWVYRVLLTFLYDLLSFETAIKCNDFDFTLITSLMATTGWIDKIILKKANGNRSIKQAS